VTELVSRVSAPALVLHRAGDGQMPVEVSRRLAGALGDATLLELPGTWPTLFHEDAHGDLDLVTRFLTTGTVPARPPAARSDGVTARELDVLRRLAAGDSNAEIARDLGIAVHTVERHTGNLYRKIGARGRADATAYALRHGIA
jgi:DNA-binding CsgD family transcriptional regulator